MAYRIQFRRDTIENWIKFNPILMEGEPGFILNSSNYKLGDGIKAWNELPMRNFNNIVDTLGDDYDSVISQGGITEVLKYIVSNNSRIDISQGWNVLDEQGENYFIALQSCGLYVLMQDQYPAYYMIVTSDNMQHGITQWVFGNLLIESDGSIQGTHNDEAARIIFRSIYWNGSLPAENLGKWSKWQYLQDDFISNDGNKKRNLDETSMTPSLKFFKDSLKEIKPIVISADEYKDLVDKGDVDEDKTYFLYDE